MTPRSMAAGWKSNDSPGWAARREDQAPTGLAVGILEPAMAKGKSRQQSQLCQANQADKPTMQLDYPFRRNQGEICSIPALLDALGE